MKKVIILLGLLQNSAALPIARSQQTPKKDTIRVAYNKKHYPKKEFRIPCINCLAHLENTKRNNPPRKS